MFPPRTFLGRRHEPAIGCKIGVFQTLCINSPRKRLHSDHGFGFRRRQRLQRCIANARADVPTSPVRSKIVEVPISPVRSRFVEVPNSPVRSGFTEDWSPRFREEAKARCPSGLWSPVAPTFCAPRLAKKRAVPAPPFAFAPGSPKLVGSSDCSDERDCIVHPENAFMFKTQHDDARGLSELSARPKQVPPGVLERGNALDETLAEDVPIFLPAYLIEAIEETARAFRDSLNNRQTDQLPEVSSNAHEVHLQNRVGGKSFRSRPAPNATDASERRTRKSTRLRRLSFVGKAIQLNKQVTGRGNREKAGAKRGVGKCLIPRRQGRGRLLHGFVHIRGCDAKVIDDARTLFFQHGWPHKNDKASRSYISTLLGRRNRHRKLPIYLAWATSRKNKSIVAACILSLYRHSNVLRRCGCMEYIVSVSRGAGSELVRLAQEFLQANGCRHLYSGADLSRPLAMRAHNSWGFCPVSIPVWAAAGLKLYAQGSVCYMTKEVAQNESGEGANLAEKKLIRTCGG